MAHHGYGPTSRARGFIRLECREDRSYFLRLAEHPALMAAMDRGDEWYCGLDNFGTKIRVRLATVMGVETFTPESTRASIVELEAKDAEARALELFGDDDAAASGREL